MRKSGQLVLIFLSLYLSSIVLFPVLAHAQGDPVKDIQSVIDGIGGLFKGKESSSVEVEEKPQVEETGRIKHYQEYTQEIHRSRRTYSPGTRRRTTRRSSEKTVTRVPSQYTEHVEVFVASRCPRCEKLEKFLRRNNIDYLRYNLDRDKRAEAEYLKNIGRGVIPVTRTMGYIVRGYHPDMILRLVKKRDLKKTRLATRGVRIEEKPEPPIEEKTLIQEEPKEVSAQEEAKPEENEKEELFGRAVSEPKKEPESDPKSQPESEQEVKTVELFASDTQEQAFAALVGDDYEVFKNRFEIITELEDLDGFSARVRAGTMRGLFTIAEAIVMYDASGQFWAAVLDDDAIRYYSNDPGHKTKLPKTIDRWRKEFPDAEIVFTEAP